MGLRRTVAEVQVKQRRKKREKVVKETRALALRRNKALKEAAENADRARALEGARQAELKKLKADERLKLARQSGRRKSGEKAVKIGKGIVKTFKKMKKTYDRR